MVLPNLARELLLGAVIHFSQNPEDGSATAPSLFWGTGALLLMPSTFDHPWMTRPR
ncbi:MAG: hypothetical protein HC827_23995 [Cyanobacteria bacterium RM1_2_2]|nr:hypothetical protein [Cyanobacteria bacterium RM1_2_2]